MTQLGVLLLKKRKEEEDAEKVEQGVKELRTSVATISDELEAQRLQVRA